MKDLIPAYVQKLCLNLFQTDVFLYFSAFLYSAANATKS